MRFISLLLLLLYIFAVRTNVQALQSTPEPVTCVPEYQAVFEVYSQGARLLNPDGFFQVEPRIVNCFVSRCLRYYYWAKYRFNCVDRESFDKIRGDALPFCDRLFSPCVSRQQALRFLEDYINGRANIPNSKPLSSPARTCLRNVVTALSFPRPRHSCTREFDVNKALNINFPACRSAT